MDLANPRSPIQMCLKCSIYFVDLADDAPRLEGDFLALYLESLADASLCERACRVARMGAVKTLLRRTARSRRACASQSRAPRSRSPMGTSMATTEGSGVSAMIAEKESRRRHSAGRPLPSSIATIHPPLHPSTPTSMVMRAHCSVELVLLQRLLNDIRIAELARDRYGLPSLARLLD